MKKLSLLLFFLLSTSIASAQIIATLEVKEDIPGICNKKAVYALFAGFKGQEEAVCPLSKEQILQRLNSEVTFLQDKPKYKDKIMISMIINCKGEVLRCETGSKSKSPELDQQIIAVMNSLGAWQAGRLDGTAVDSSRLISFKIKNGKVMFS